MDCNVVTKYYCMGLCDCVTYIIKYALGGGAYINVFTIVAPKQLRSVLQWFTVTNRNSRKRSEEVHFPDIYGYMYIKFMKSRFCFRRCENSFLFLSLVR